MTDDAFSKPDGGPQLPEWWGDMAKPRPDRVSPEDYVWSDEALFGEGQQQLDDPQSWIDWLAESVIL